MQIVAVPLYNQSMTEEAYVFRDLKSNNLFSTSQALNLFDGATMCDSLEVLNRVGLDAFTLGKPIFIPIQEVNLIGNLASQCREAPSNIVFVLEKPLSDHNLYFPHVQQLVERGYRIAINYPIKHAPNDQILSVSSFIFLSHRPERLEETSSTLDYVKKYYRNLVPVAIHIYTHETLDSIQGKGFGLFESRIYKAPRRAGGISPLKVSSVRLINAVQNDDFSFDDVTRIVRGDPALTISLLKIVNASTHMRGKISTIQHAVAMLGQREVRKWVTTAVARSLGSDRPSEITRISLIRAKFAENLAPYFEMAHMVGELFLAGLFSVIDNMLELPMAEALQQVIVTENVRSALVDGKGIYAPVLQFIRDYETASWSSVSRHMIVYSIDEDSLADAYIDALLWYRDLVTVDVELS